MLGRTAENLFWLSRYVERAENVARLLEVGYRMSLTARREGGGRRIGSEGGGPPRTAASTGYRAQRPVPARTTRPVASRIFTSEAKHRPASYWRSYSARLAKELWLRAETCQAPVIPGRRRK